MNPVDPNASAVSVTGAPERRLILGIIGGMISAVVLSVLKHYLGDIVPPEVVAGVPALVTAGIAYLVAMTKQEVANRVDNTVVKIANASVGNPTTAVVVDHETADRAAAIDIRAGAVPAPAPLKGATP